MPTFPLRGDDLGRQLPFRNIHGVIHFGGFARAGVGIEDTTFAGQHLEHAFVGGIVSDQPVDLHHAGLTHAVGASHGLPSASSPDCSASAAA